MYVLGVKISIDRIPWSRALIMLVFWHCFCFSALGHFVFQRFGNLAFSCVGPGALMNPERKDPKRPGRRGESPRVLGQGSGLGRAGSPARNLNSRCSCWRPPSCGLGPSYGLALRAAFRTSLTLFFPPRVRKKIERQAKK